MIQVAGIGWITSTQYGCIRLGTQIDYAERCSFHALGKTDAFFNYAVKNFGRFDAASRQACYTVSLALKDAGITYAENERLDIAVLGTSQSGCMQVNLEYFSDYITCGRTLSRGNLFIYTLPTSPLAEVAIHFGLQGPLMYMVGKSESLEHLLNVAAGMVNRGEIPAATVVRSEEEGAICVLLSDGRTTRGNELCSLEDLQVVIRDTENMRNIIDQTAKLKKDQTL